MRDACGYISRSSPAMKMIEPMDAARSLQTVRMGQDTERSTS